MSRQKRAAAMHTAAPIGELVQLEREEQSARLSAARGRRRRPRSNAASLWNFPSCIADRAAIQRHQAIGGTAARRRRLSSDNERTEMIMSDYRDPNDPMRWSAPYGAERSYATWGWVAAAAVLLIIVLAIGFGIRNKSMQTASNDATETTRMAPLRPPNPGIASPANPAFAPHPAPGANPAPQGSQ